MARALAADGLDAIEVFHPDHGPEQEARLGQLVNELGLAVTAGSDFHGTPEGRKRPGGVSGDGEMLGILRARARR
jgi:predicted metal-dependent phosphoesterase TrpH